MATETKPERAEVQRESTIGLSKQGLTPTGRVNWNLIAPELMRAAAQRGEGEFAAMGPFVAVTSPHTGRSPNDKFVVKESTSEADVDWGKVNQPYSPEHYRALLGDVREYLDKQEELFVEGSLLRRRSGLPAVSVAMSRRTRGTWRSCATCSSAPS